MEAGAPMNNFGPLPPVPEPPDIVQAKPAPTPSPPLPVGAEAIVEAYNRLFRDIRAARGRQAHQTATERGNRIGRKRKIDRARVRALLDGGMTKQGVARELNVTPSAITKITKGLGDENE